MDPVIATDSTRKRGAIASNCRLKPMRLLCHNSALLTTAVKFSIPFEMKAAKPLTFGAVVREARVKAGMSQRELAGLVGCSRCNLNRIERGGNSSPGLELVKRIASVLVIEARKIFETPK